MKTTNYLHVMLGCLALVGLGCDAGIGGNNPDGELEGPGVVGNDTKVELFCTNTKDDGDKDRDIDCGDADCSSLAVCNPGNTEVGGACNAHNDCDANNRDPFCFDEIQTGFPGGLCSEVCQFTTDSTNNPTVFEDDCSANSVCLSTSGNRLSGSGLCRPLCDSDADCRDGYQCLGTVIAGNAFSGGSIIVDTCQPSCTDDAQCAISGSCSLLDLTGGTDLVGNPARRGNSGHCTTTPEICDNQINDDFPTNGGDGIDCSDLDCQLSEPACTETDAECADGIDNDNDGRVDCSDSDCSTAANC